MPLISRRKFLLSIFSFILFSDRLLALDIKGVNYMPISELARLCGMRYKTLEAKKIQKVYSKTSTMTFTVNSRAMTLNNSTIWLGHPICEEKGMLYIARRDLPKTISPILYPQNNGTVPNLFHIVIDPGHGGKDTGAINKALGIREKSVNLDIALRLGRELMKNGYKVSYTRANDSFLELDDRIKLANAKRANLFISIHANSVGTPSISGIETFSMTPRWMQSTTSQKPSRSDSTLHPGNANDSWNQLLSYYIQRSVQSATNSPDRGVKRARFAVLRPAKMPAALVECGFISNNSECRKLATSSYRQKVAESIASGIIRYHSTLRRLKK